MENAWLPDRLCGKEEELKSLCWRPRRSLPQSEEASVTAQLYYSESCCPGFYLLFDSLLELWTMGNINTFVCFERQLYCFTSLRLIGQITAYFSVDANPRVHCASWRIFSCSGVCVSVCQSDSTLCTDDTFCIYWTVGVSEDGCRKAFSINAECLISSNETGREMLLQMFQGTNFHLSSWDYCFLRKTLSFHLESLSHSCAPALRFVVILVQSASLALVPAEVMDGGESSRSPGWLAVGELTED